MRTMRVPGFVFATLAGLTLAACQLALGFGDKDFSNGTGGAGGTGATSSSTSNHGPTTSTSSTGGHGGKGTGGHGGMPSGTGASTGTGGHGGGMSTAGEGVWSVSFDPGPKATVNAIAAGLQNTVYLTGTAPDVSAFGCPAGNTGDAGDAGGAETGYLVQLDDKHKCVWGFFFGASGVGTGVAVDGLGNVALTGTFVGTLAIDPAGNPMTSDTATNSDAFVAVFDSSQTLKWVGHIGAGAQTPPPPPSPPDGDRVTTGVALNGGTLAVSGYYTSSLGVDSPPHATFTPKKLAGSADAKDAFVIWFDPTSGVSTGALTITSPANAGADQVTNSVALDTNGDVAFTGMAKGLTSFNGPPQYMASTAGQIMLGSYTLATTSQSFAALLSGQFAQAGSSVAFDGTGNLLLGGQYSGTVGVIGPSDAGASYTSAANATNALIARYDGNGNPLASISFGPVNTPDTTTVAGVAPHSDSTSTSVVFAGGVSGPASFSSPSAPMWVGESGITAIYVAKVQGDLSNVLWFKGFTDTTTPGEPSGSMAATAVTVDPADGSVLLAGYYAGTLDFGGKTSALPQAAVGAPSLFVAKLNP